MLKKIPSSRSVGSCQFLSREFALHLRSLIDQLLVKLYLPTIFLVILSAFIFNTQPASAAQEASPSPISEAEITENLKERLKKVIQNQETAELKKRAWVGELVSIANNTLTIETREGPKLASISAETSFVRNPKRTKIGLDDLALGSHTIAMGLLNGNQVLNTTRVVVEDEPEIYPQKQALFASLVSYSLKTDELEFQTQSSQIYKLEITKDTIISAQTDSQITEVDTDYLEAGQKTVIIIKTEEDEDETTQTLLRLHILSQDQEEPAPTVIGPEIQ